jgi:formamidopyrimidine-DNA glycosylase
MVDGLWLMADDVLTIHHRPSTMPELPEVETYKRYFARHALGQTIERVDVRDERILTIPKDKFVRALKGRTFDEVRRHGKHLFAHVDGGRWLHLHFGMTGDLAYYREGEGPRFAKVVFDFDNGAHLAFEDMRLFGFAGLVESPEAFIAEAGLGPDPLDRKFTRKRFDELLEGRKGAIKSLLMSQEIVAGLGNLWVDETLYQAGISPRRPVHRIRDSERGALYDAMRRVLREVLARHDRGADPPAEYLYHHREAGERCRKCEGTLRRTVVFGRTTYFCPRHQR